MIKKVSEIFTAWKISYSPTDLQADLAAKRIQICDECEFKKTSPTIHCGVCGCSLKKKIYSPVKGACPKGKWNQVDNE